MSVQYKPYDAVLRKRKYQTIIAFAALRSVRNRGLRKFERAWLYNFITLLQGRHVVDNALALAQAKDEMHHANITRMYAQREAALMEPEVIWRKLVWMVVGASRNQPILYLRDHRDLSVKEEASAYRFPKFNYGFTPHPEYSLIVQIAEFAFNA